MGLCGWEAGSARDIVVDRGWEAARENRDGNGGRGSAGNVLVKDGEPERAGADKSKTNLAASSWSGVAECRHSRPSHEQDLQ